MNDETLAEGRDKVLKEQIDDIFARACLNNEYFGIDGWYELHTPTLRKEIQELILQDRERAVNAGRIEELEKLITLNKTLNGVEAEMTRRANNRLAKLSNLTQEKEE